MIVMSERPSQKGGYGVPRYQYMFGGAPRRSVPTGLALLAVILELEACGTILRYSQTDTRPSALSIKLYQTRRSSQDDLEISVASADLISRSACSVSTSRSQGHET